MLFHPLHVGLFCQHVLAVFEHIRLDKIPDKYILQRYTKDPVTEPDFNRRDHVRTDANGTTLLYKRTILYNEAMKTVNKGCSSDRMFDLAISAFKFVNERLDGVAMDTDDTATRSVHDGDMPDANDGNDADHHDDIQPPPAVPYKNIKPPSKAKTKGSKSTAAEVKANKKQTSAPKRPEPELDESGNPKGQRLCSNCGKIAGHNSRTCKKRQLAAQLLEKHRKMHGDTSTPGDLDLCIKKVLAQQSFTKIDSEEEILTTDEDEESEDDAEEVSTDTEEEDGQSTEEEAQYSSNDEESKQDTKTEENQARHDSGLIDKGQESVADGKRTCSICNEKKKHNSRTDRKSVV